MILQIRTRKRPNFWNTHWFNIAAGLAFVVLQLVMFRGESKCRKPPQFGQQFHYMFKSQKVTVIWINVLVSFHVASLTTIISCGNSFLQLVKIH